MLIKFFIAFLFCGNALAWNFTQDFQNGFYWQSLPVAIQVVDPDPDRKSKLEWFAREAVREWEKGTALDLWDLSSTATTNIVRWSNNFANETNMDAASVLAVAIRYTGGPYFAKAEIIINGSHPLNHNDVHLLTTMTHELGHTMGLDHSNESQAIMAPTLQQTFNGISFDDRSGMHEAFKEMQHRQVTGYVSPLSYENETTKQPLSCGTVAIATATPAHGLLSLVAGILIAFVRKILSWFKSLL